MIDIRDTKLRARVMRAAEFGAVRALGYLLREIAGEILTYPPGSLGVSRATHAIAMVNVVYSALHPNNPSFFPGEFNHQIREKLDLLKATLQPEESRFEDIFGWDTAHRDMICDEFRSNFERLLRAEGPSDCIKLGLMVHLVFDHYLSLHDTSMYHDVGVIHPKDVVCHHEFAVLYAEVGSLVREMQQTEPLLTARTA